MFGGKRKRGGGAPEGTRGELAAWVDFCVQKGLVRVAVDGEDGGRGDRGEQVPLARSGNAGTAKRQVELAFWWINDQGESLLRLRHHVDPAASERTSGKIVVDKVARSGEDAHSKDRGVAAAMEVTHRIPLDLAALRTAIRRRTEHGPSTGHSGDTGDPQAASSHAEMAVLQPVRAGGTGEGDAGSGLASP